MFKYDKIKIKLFNNNIRRYQNKYGNSLKIGDEIDVFIVDLPKYSNERLSVICDVCGEEHITSLCNLNKYPNNDINKYYCKKCKYEKYKKTCLEKYNVENIFQLDSIKEKSKETCLKKYGCEYAVQNKEILEKQKITNKDRYGFEFQMQNPENVKKSKETCMKKYNHTSNMGDEKIFNKQRKSGKKIKKFRNTDLYYQGSYELDFLNKFYDKYTIKRSKTIKYIIDNKEKVYYPDFYIVEKDIVVEIKSSYWYNQNKDLCIEKENEIKKLGFNYIIIFDKKYSDFNLYLQK